MVGPELMIGKCTVSRLPGPGIGDRAAGLVRIVPYSICCLSRDKNAMKMTDFRGLSRCDKDLLLGTCVTWGSILIALIAVIYLALTQDAPRDAEAAASIAERPAGSAVSGDSG